MKGYWQKNILNAEQIPIVSEQPVYILGKESNYKAIIDDKKEPLSIVSHIYNTTQHRDVYKYATSLDKYRLVKSQLIKGGRVLMVELEDYGRDELLEGDYFTPRVRLFNSYDRSTGLSVQSYGLRLVCDNGMIAPAFSKTFHHKHTYNNLNLHHIPEYIERAMQSWDVAKETLAKAHRTNIKVEDALSYVKTLPKKYTKIVQENLGYKENVYDIWNELTRTITHDVGNKVATTTFISYQQLTNNVFKCLNRE